MIQLGKINDFTVLEIEEDGLWLDGEDLGRLWLPKRLWPQDFKAGDQVTLFIYLDADCKPVVTIERPFAQVGELVGLKVISANKLGAFLDWGMKKDLFVPAREQQSAMQVGRTYLVRLGLDYEGRMVGTSKIDRYLSIEMPPFKPHDEVLILPGERTPLGIKAVVNGCYQGMLFRNEIFGNVMTGRPTRAWVKQVRDDGKIDLSLNQPGLGKSDDAAEKVLARLKKQGGILQVSDKSEPELIYQLFGVSKATFKKAIGALYKRGEIELTKEEIRLRSKE